MNLKFKIAKRAAPRVEGFNHISFLMDLDSLDGQIDLEKLLAAPDADFFHDVHGIRAHMDRRTFPGKLKNFFVPRCAIAGAF